VYTASFPHFSRLASRKKSCVNFYVFFPPGVDAAHSVIEDKNAQKFVSIATLAKAVRRRNGRGSETKSK
jgi:hypothetical protein